MSTSTSSQRSRPGWRTRLVWGAVLLLPPLLACLLYLPALRLPLLYDTLLHTQLADGLDLRSVWLPDARFGFYRPLVFLPMVVIERLFGGYPAWLLQGLNLLQHALNALLLGGLIKRVGGNGRLALFSGLLFASFPFAYQTLAIYGNNAYLTVTSLILLGLHLWLSDRPWRWASALLLVLSLLVHEIGILLGPLCAALLLVEPHTRAQRNLKIFLRRPVLWLLGSLSVGYLVLYPFLATGSGPQLDYGGNDPWLKLLLFGQTLGYPLAWLARPLGFVSAQAIVLLAAGLTLVGIGWLAYRRPTLRAPLLFGGLWWVLASLVVALTLPTYYIAGGARLLYVGSAGLALLWGSLISGLAQTARPLTLSRGLRHGLALATLLFIVGSSSSFVLEMLDLYAQVGEPIQAVQNVEAEIAPGESITFFNLPQWVSPERNQYAVGVEIAPGMGDHLFEAELVKANLDREHPTFVVQAPGLLNESVFNYGLYSLTAVDQLPAAHNGEPIVHHVFVSDFQPHTIQTRYSGRASQLPLLPTEETDWLATIGGYRLWQASGYGCDGGIEIGLIFEKIDPAAVAPTQSLFVQLLGVDGSLQGQADGPLLGVPAQRLADELRWFVDRREIPAVNGRLPGTLFIGIYDFSTGNRAEARDSQGNLLPDSGLRIPVTNCQ